MDWTTIAIIAAAVLLVGHVISIYNTLVRLAQQADNGFAQIDVQLKRRHDLIPNLVKTARAYLKHERETLEAVVQARNQASAALDAARANAADPDAMRGLAQSEGALGAALGRLQVAVEAYPDLKATQNMQQLSENLTTTENQVAFARQGFNDFVTAFNVYRRSFPPVLFASLFGHPADRTLLEFEDRAGLEQAPQVNFE